MKNKMPKQGKIDAYFRRSTFGEDVRKKYDSLNKMNSLVGQSNITLQEFKEFSNVKELITADIKQQRPERYHKELKRIDLYIEQIYKKFLTSTNCGKNKLVNDLKFHPKPWLTKADLALLRELDIKPCYVNMCRNNFVPVFISVLLKKSDRLHGIEAREKMKLNSGFYLGKMISEYVTRFGSLDEGIDYFEKRYINKYKDGKLFKKKDMSEKACPISKKPCGFKFEKPCPLSKKKYMPEIESKCSSVADNKPCPLSKKKCTSNIERPCSPISNNKPCPLSKKKYMSEIASKCSSVADNKPCPLSKKKYMSEIESTSSVADNKPCPLSKKKYSSNIAEPCSSGSDKRNTLVGQSDITLQEFKEFSNVKELIIADIKQRRPERYHKELKRIDLYIEQVYKKFLTRTNCGKNKLVNDLKFHPKPWLTKADLALLRELDIKPCYVNMCRNNFVPVFISVLLKKSDRLRGIEAREKMKLNSGFYLGKMISEYVTRFGSLDKGIDYFEKRYINKYKDGKLFKKKDMSEKACPLSKKPCGFKFEKPCPLSKKKYILEIESKCSSVADNKPCPLSKKKCTSNIERPCSPISNIKPCPLSKKKYTAEIESKCSSVADNKPCPLSKKKCISNIAGPCSPISSNKPCPLSKKKYMSEIESTSSSVADNKPCPLSKRRRTSNMERPCSPISNVNSCPLPDKTSNFYANDTNTKKLSFDEISRQFMEHCTITSSGTEPEVQLNKIVVNRKFDLENLPGKNHLSRITHRNSPLLDNESNSYSNSLSDESYPTVINAKTRKYITNQKVAIEKIVEPDDFNKLKINQSDLLQIIKSRYPYLSNDDQHIVLQKYIKTVLFNFDAVKGPIDELKEKASKGLDCKLSSKTSEHKSKSENENVAVTQNYPWPQPKLLSFSDFIKYTNVEDHLRDDIMRRFPKDHKRYLKQLPKCIKNFYKNIFLAKNEWPPGLKFNTSDLKELYAANKHNVHSNNNNNIIIDPSTCKQGDHSSHRTPQNNNPQRELLREDNLPKNVDRNQEINAPMLIGSCPNEDPRQSEEKLENEHSSEGNRSEVLCHNLEKFLSVNDINARKESPSIKTSTKDTVETEILYKETVQTEDTTSRKSKSVHQKSENQINIPQNLIKSRNHIVLDRVNPKSLTFNQFKERTNIEEYIRKDILKKFPETSQKYLPKMQKLIKRFYKKFFITFPTFPEGLIYIPIKPQNRIITRISNETNVLAEKNNIEDNDGTIMVLSENLCPDKANLDRGDNHVNILRPTEPSQDLFSCSDKSKINDIIFVSCRDCESQDPLSMTDPLNIQKKNNVIRDIIIEKNNDISLPRYEDYEKEPKDIEFNSFDKVLITGTDKSNGIMTEIHEDISIKQECEPISLSYKDVEIILTVTPPPIVIEDNLEDADDYLAEMLLNSHDKIQNYDKNNIVLPPTSVPSELCNFPVEISTSSKQQNNETELDTFENTNQVDPVRNKNLTLEITPENNIDLSEQIEHRTNQSDSDVDTNPQTATLLNSCIRNGKNSSFNLKSTPNVHEFENSIAKTSQQNDAENISNELPPDEQNTSLSVFGHMTTTKISKDLSSEKIRNDNLCKNIMEATDNNYKCIENKESNYYNKQASTQHLHVINIENMPENATQHLNIINIENIPELEPETITKMQNEQNKVAPLEQEEHPNSSSNEYSNHKVYYNHRLNLNVQKPNANNQLEDVGIKNQTTTITHNETNETKKSLIEVVPKKRPKLVEEVEKTLKRRKMEQSHKKCKGKDGNSDRPDEDSSNKDFVPQTKHNFGPLALIQKKVNYIAATNNCQVQASKKTKQKPGHSSNEDPDYRIDDSSQISVSQFLNSDNTYFTGSQLGTEERILITEKSLTPDKSTSSPRISTESTPTSSFTRAVTPKTDKTCPEPAENGIIKLLRPIRPPAQFGCITYLAISKIILNSKINRMYYDSSIPFLQPFEKQPLQATVNFKSNGFRQLNICGSSVRLLLGFTVKELSCVIKILKIIDTFKYEPINPEPTNESLPYRILYYLFKTIPKFSQVYFEYEDHNINYVKCVSINNNNTTSYKPISCLTTIIDNDILDEIKKLKQKLDS